jgi:hypothetical protein
MMARDIHLQRSTENLLGYLQGVVADDHISDLELAKLQEWLIDHAELRHEWPFSELISRLETMISDCVIDEHERAELLEWCADLSLPDHIGYELIDMANRQLHGFLHGLQADGIVTVEEAYGLHDWLQNFTVFRDCWPFSHAFKIIESILEDDHVTEAELDVLKTFCEQFAEQKVENPVPQERDLKFWELTSAPHLKPISYICNSDTQLEFQGRCFCFTGKSLLAPRADLHAMVVNLGGECAQTIVRKLDYLVIGAIGSPMWVFSTYGRKIEKAISQGVVVIDENLFIAAARSALVKP